MHLFRCPECGREHHDPAEGTFVLAVVCFDCAFAVENESENSAPDEALFEAA